MLKFVFDVQPGDAAESFFRGVGTARTILSVFLLSSSMPPAGGDCLYSSFSPIYECNLGMHGRRQSELYNNFRVQTIFGIGTTV